MLIRPLVLALLLVAAHAHAAAKPKAKSAPPAQETPAENIDVDAMARAKDAAAGNSVPPPADAATDTTPSNAAATAKDEAPSTPTEATATAPPTSAGQAAVPPLLAPAPNDDEKRLAAACEGRSTSLLDSAQKGDYANATRDFDAKMRSAMPAPKFKQAWESLSQFGGLTARGQSHVSRGQGYIAVTIPLIFEKANLFVQIACGSDGRIAGFNVKPLEISKP